MYLRVCIQIRDSLGNEHGHPKDIAGESRQAFTSPADTAFDVCFTVKLINARRMPFRPLHPPFLQS
jgi:hypothetical protein